MCLPLRLRSALVAWGEARRVSRRYGETLLCGETLLWHSGLPVEEIAALENIWSATKNQISRAPSRFLTHPRLQLQVYFRPPPLMNTTNNPTDATNHATIMHYRCWLLSPSTLTDQQCPASTILRPKLSLVGLGPDKLYLQCVLGRK